MEMAEPLRDPAQLNMNSSGASSFHCDLVNSVKPLLMRAGLTAHPEARKRHEENVPAALAVILEKWGDPANRVVQGREVCFEEFVAIHLAREVRRLDQEQRPDL